jgi:hypothetical protein
MTEGRVCGRLDGPRIRGGGALERNPAFPEATPRQSGRGGEGVGESSPLRVAAAAMARRPLPPPKPAPRTSDTV